MYLIWNGLYWELPLTFLQHTSWVASQTYVLQHIFKGFFCESVRYLLSEYKTFYPIFQKLSEMLKMHLKHNIIFQKKWENIGSGLSASPPPQWKHLHYINASLTEVLNLYKINGNFFCTLWNYLHIEFFIFFILFLTWCLYSSEGQREVFSILFLCKWMNQLFIQCQLWIKPWTSYIILGVT